MMYHVNDNVFEKLTDMKVMGGQDKVVKRYTIDGGMLIAPIVEEYSLETPYQSIFATSLNLNFIFEETKKSPEELIEQFLNDEDAVMNWLEDLKHPDPSYNLSPVPKFQIVKKTKVIMTEGSDPEADRFLRTEYWLNREVISSGDEVIEMIKSHPKYQEMVDRAEQIASENEKIAQLNEKDCKETLRRNAYETWKILEAKRKLGEFADYESQ